MLWRNTMFIITNHNINVVRLIHTDPEHIAVFGAVLILAVFVFVLFLVIKFYVFKEDKEDDK